MKAEMWKSCTKVARLLESRSQKKHEAGGVALEGWKDEYRGTSVLKYLFSSSPADPSVFRGVPDSQA